jgi:hypothetical protein
MLDNVTTEPQKFDFQQEDFFVYFQSYPLLLDKVKE